MQDKGGAIAVLSSVAGDRGRGSNYCYGATKAALTAYADGLRGRLNDTGVNVVTVKPGPVKTAMTAGLPGYEKMAEPAQVAKQIVRAIDKRKNTVYTPGKWRLIMAVIRAIPEFIFKKLSI
jgi:short-subunit dehydrogenase